MIVELHESKGKVCALQQQTKRAKVALKHSLTQQDSLRIELRASMGKVSESQQRHHETKVALEKSIKKAEMREGEEREDSALNLASANTDQVRERDHALLRQGIALEEAQAEIKELHAHERSLERKAKASVADASDAARKIEELEASVQSLKLLLASKNEDMHDDKGEVIEVRVSKVSIDPIRDRADNS